MNPRPLLIAAALVVAPLVAALGAVALLDSDDETLSAADSAVRPTVAPTAAPEATDAPSTSATLAPTTTLARTTTTSRPARTTTTVTTRPAPPPPTTLPGATPNAAPRVSITSPGSGSRYAATYNPADGSFGAVVSFSASVSDPEGDGYTIEWFSSLDGYLGSGASISARLRPRGDASQPVITAVVTDVTGARGEASVQVVVWIPSDQ